jgi:hypothetical protein
MTAEHAREIRSFVTNLYLLRQRYGERLPPGLMEEAREILADVSDAEFAEAFRMGKQ